MKPCVTPLSPDFKTTRKWTGRNARGDHFGRIPWEQSPLTMALYWKEDKDSKAFLVGCFRIDLECLCKHGYARYDKTDKVILRFQRTNGRIEIAVNRSVPALKIGVNPVAKRR